MLRLRGTSTMTCLPDSRAARVYCSWWSKGRRLIIRATAGWLMTSSGFVVICGMRSECWVLCSRVLDVVWIIARV